MLNEIKELITFSAFRPSKGDARYALNERFTKESFMGVILKGKGAVLTKVQFSKKGMPAIEAMQEVELDQKDELIAAIAEYAQKHKLSHAAVVLNAQLNVIPFNGEISDTDNLSERISLNPESVLGSLCNKEYKYLYLGSDQRPIEYLFCYTKENINAVVELIESAGLEIVRLACPIQSALFKASEGSKNMAVLIYMNGYYVFAIKKDQKWVDLILKPHVAPLSFKESAQEAIESLSEEIQEVQFFTDTEIRLEDPRIKNNFENNLLSPLHITVAG